MSNKVPFLDLQYHLDDCGPQMIAACQEVIESKRWINGQKVKEFERELAWLAGTDYAVGMSSGTDALLACLMALEIGIGDHVLVPAYSFISTAEVVARVGASIIFVDIDKETLTMCPTDLGKKVRLANKMGIHPKVCIPVHLYGRMCDMDAIMDICDYHEIQVIEDACQSIGAGEVHGTAACFSFFPSKNLGGCGDGGAVVTNYFNFENNLRAVRNHGCTTKYFPHTLGGNFRLDEIQAALLLAKLPFLESWIEERKSIADAYMLQLADVEQVDVLESDTYNCLTITADNRNLLREHLTSKGIGTEVYYPKTLSSMPMFEMVPEAFRTCRNAEWASEFVLSLPIYPGLSHSKVEYICDVIRSFYE